MAKIRLRQFRIEKDLEIINAWLMVHKHATAAASSIPRIGFIAYRGRYPVAAAFLRQCEGNYALLDGLVTNPAAEGKFRHEAIDLLVERIIVTANQLRLTGLLAISADASTLLRSEKHGFEKLQYTVIAKDLSNSVFCQ